ncbi:MAG: hypothetical protein O4861_11455 [Trichodesmium sp. St16_bin4-tuft]|nr:hypothetical protein [Trichodesmium sp. MAG_R01]MDE5068326.1 hypothetical protein [Trichodesmium sp. St4_bin8_1]MDE5071299.1 hypothetical protein [Trichodesmium sp. St5_bin8]MDE5078634.1 hypothetical protein [Trichodesmium sp. St2_bin6]MDE5093289.1 hypothetical protein [Trichodesmium sp. St11_bin5]MDE5098912.1 hypothetical protein [Trichodesmium sp. St16_bin4-tuft]MDE5102318.1 hypothetical protein [Trichodesmium sp. St19_bin2]
MRRGYSAQFLVNLERKETHNFEENLVGINLSLNAVYTDNNDNIKVII